MGVWNVVSKGPEVGLSLLGTYILEGDRVVSVLVVNLLLFSLPDLSARRGMILMVDPSSIAARARVLLSPSPYVTWYA